MIKQKEKNELTTTELLELPGDFAEKYVLKQLANPDNPDSSFFIFQNFQEKWFKDEHSTTLFKILKAYWSKYQEAPKKEVLQQIFNNKKFKDNEQELNLLLEKVSSIKTEEYNKTYLQEMLVKFTKERAIYFTILDNINNIEQHGDINVCFSKFEEIAKYDLNTNMGIEYFENIDSHIDRLIKPDLKLSTGFTQLDSVTYGGLPTDDTCLFLFMAKPGLGKSMFMANLAANWILQEKNVLIITLEMSEHMYSMRMDSIFSDININKLKDASEGLRKRLKSMKLNLPKAHLQIKEFPTGTCNAMMIKQYCKKLKEVRGFKPDVIIVDYLNIVKPNSGVALNLYEKGKAVAEELRAISGEFHIPVVSAVQSNKSGSGGGYATDNIDIDNSAESGGIPATADAMFAAYQMEGEREAGKINLKVVKNRLGGFIGNSIAFEVNYDTLKLFDWNSESDISEDDISVNKQKSVIEKDTEELDKALDEL